MVFIRIPVEIFSAQFANINLVYDVNRCVVKCVWIIRFSCVYYYHHHHFYHHHHQKSLLCVKHNCLLSKSPMVGEFSQEGFFMIIYHKGYLRRFISNVIRKILTIMILNFRDIGGYKYSLIVISLQNQVLSQVLLVNSKLYSTHSRCIN